jgi:hypothetical protein
MRELSYHKNGSTDSSRLNAGTARLQATSNNCMAVLNFEILVGASCAVAKEGSKYRLKVRYKMGDENF